MELSPKENNAHLKVEKPKRTRPKRKSKHGSIQLANFEFSQNTMRPKTIPCPRKIKIYK